MLRDDEIAISRVLFYSWGLAGHISGNHIEMIQDFTPAKDKSGGRNR
ncbi:MAG: hypothetical protein ABJO72_04295 [Hyphomicrobiales bacterium]